MDVNRIRQDFPLLQKRKIIYFDNACTTLKPQQVIDAVLGYYSDYTGCAGRSIHKLATETTEAFEKARERIREYYSHYVIGQKLRRLYEAEIEACGKSH